jgi:hypothetical protein
MANKDLNLRIIGGNSPLLLATIKRKGEVVNSKTHGLEMYIARYGNTLDDRPKNGYIAKFYYDRSLRILRTIIPKKQSIEMVGDFVYHYGITTENNLEIRPEYGRINFIQGMEE